MEREWRAAASALRDVGCESVEVWESAWRRSAESWLLGTDVLMDSGAVPSSVMALLTLRRWMCLEAES